MKTKSLLLAICLLVFFLPGFSQFKCGFDDIHQRKLKTDPAYRKRVAETEQSIQAYIKKNKKRLSARVFGTAAPIYTIPVVVHVIHTGGSVGTIYNPSDAQIQGAINYLNQVFDGSYPGMQGAGDLQIQFALAQRDPNCNATTGINRIDGSSLSGYAANGLNYYNSTGASELSIKNLSRWDAFDYYNIWVVNKIDGNDGTSGTFLAGFAYFPGNDPLVDGTVMLATQMTAGAKTLPHEIGHALALLHPFEGSSGSTCSANTNCLAQGDGVCDTDPITQPSGFVCRTGTNSCTGTPYNNYTEYNFMNYTICYNLFTPDQKTRMLAVAASIYRNSLTTSPALTSANISFPYTAPINASCTPVSNAFGISGHFAGLMNISINGRSIGSSSTRFDNGYVNGTNCIKLLQLNKGNTYSFSMTVVDANRHQLRAWIDYNNDGTFDNATEQIYLNTDMGNGVYTANNSFTVPTTAVSNTVVRMRVIEDLIYGPATAINDACYNPYYGQAEDYGVYLANMSILTGSFIEFSGRLVKDEISLNWKTKEEAQIKDYEVEKSTDGMNFYRIGRVIAKAGTSSYAFTDIQVDAMNYYRLRINKFNGDHSYSHVIQVNEEPNKQDIVLRNNPFNSSLNISFSNKATKAKLQLINLAGSLVYETEFNSPPQQLNWQIKKDIGSGLYILKIFADEKVFIKKVIKE